MQNDAAIRKLVIRHLPSFWSFINDKHSLCLPHVAWFKPWETHETEKSLKNSESVVLNAISKGELVQEKAFKWQKVWTPSWLSD